MVISEAIIADAHTLGVTLGIGLARLTLDASTVREEKAIVADTGAKAIVMGVGLAGSGSVEDTLTINAHITSRTGGN